MGNSIYPNENSSTKSIEKWVGKFVKNTQLLKTLSNQDTSKAGGYIIRPQLKWTLKSFILLGTPYYHAYKIILFNQQIDWGLYKSRRII